MPRIVRWLQWDLHAASDHVRVNVCLLFKNCIQIQPIGMEFLFGSTIKCLSANILILATIIPWSYDFPVEAIVKFTVNAFRIYLQARLCAMLFGVVVIVFVWANLRNSEMTIKAAIFTIRWRWCRVREMVTDSEPELNVAVFDCLKGYKTNKKTS